jgi:hypothetical protein
MHMVIYESITSTFTNGPKKPPKNTSTRTYISGPTTRPPSVPIRSLASTRHDRQVAGIPQSAIASTSSNTPPPPTTSPRPYAPLHWRSKTLASSSWIGNDYLSPPSRRSATPLQGPKSLQTRSMPQSSFAGPSSSRPIVAPSPPLTQRPPTSASTASFYSTAPTNPTAPPPSKPKKHASSDWDWDYSADRYYLHPREDKEGRHDAVLMLYRAPPAWGALPEEGVGARDAYGGRGGENMKGEAGGVLWGKRTGGVVPVRRVGKAVGDVVVIDQKRIEAVRKKEGERQAALVALQESAKWRSGLPVGRKAWDTEGGSEGRSDILVAGSGDSTPAVTVNMGKNPFRRRIPVDMGGNGSGTGVSAGPTAKYLKPISAVKVPLLPKGALEREVKRNKTRPNMKVGGPLTRHRSPAVEGSSVLSSSNNTAVIVTGHKLRLTRTHTGNEGMKRSRSTTPFRAEEPRTKKGRLSEPAPATIEAKRKMNTAAPSMGPGTNQGFNWSTWAVR